METVCFSLSRFPSQRYGLQFCICSCSMHAKQLSQSLPPSRACNSIHPLCRERGSAVRWPPRPLLLGPARVQYCHGSRSAPSLVIITFVTMSTHLMAYSSYHTPFFLLALILCSLDQSLWWGLQVGSSLSGNAFLSLAVEQSCHAAPFPEKFAVNPTVS